MRRTNRATSPISPSDAARLATLLLVTLLSACAETGVGALFGNPAGTVATTAPDTRAGIQQVELADGRPADGAPRPEPRQASLAAPPVDDDPRQLVGLGPSNVAERLGSPGFVRRDGSAEVWQYAAEACILDVFLYREGDAFTVSHVALRGRGAARQSRRECFADMLRAQAGQPRG